MLLLLKSKMWILFPSLLAVLLVSYLFQLVDTKSGDKKTSLMHFLVQTVQDKFPDLMNFDSELRFLDKAALGNSLSLAVETCLIWKSFADLFLCMCMHANRQNNI